MRFVIYGRFHADDIDDAFVRLAEHFKDLADDEAPRRDLDEPHDLVIEPGWMMMSEDR